MYLFICTIRISDQHGPASYVNDISKDTRNIRMPVKTGACHLRNSDGLLRVVLGREH